MARHLLVTNDFPPKIGGIQNYLWELWRRLPADELVVYTTPHADAEAFDAAQPFTVVRSREPWLLPHPLLRRRVDRMARDFDAEIVILDPALPVGLIGPSLDVRYGVVLHGAEVAIPSRIPGVRALLNRVLDGTAGVIAAGGYPAEQAERSLGRSLPVSIVAPGVDTERFVPLDRAARRAARKTLGLPTDAPLVTSVSRLVPRKGMDTLIRASLEIRRTKPDVCVAIAGAGRDHRRLSSLISRLDAPVKLLGRIDPDELSLLVGCGDVFAMLCRSRWGGLEQEGFGIVFLEAAAAGVAQVAGRSGGAHEAVVHNQTGLIVDDPSDAAAAARAITELLDDAERRQSMAQQARERAERESSYDILARRLGAAINTMARR